MGRITRYIKLEITVGQIRLHVHPSRMMKVNGVAARVGVAFKHDMTTATPDISYLTMLDNYTIVGITFLVALIVCHSIIGLLCSIAIL